MAPTPAPTGPGQSAVADGALWESYDTTAYVVDEETGETTPSQPEAWAWRCVGLEPSLDVARADCAYRGGQLVSERAWLVESQEIRERRMTTEGVAMLVRPMDDAELADLAAEAEQRQVAALRAEVGEPLDSAEVDASLAALTEDSIQYRVAIQVLVQTLVPQAQQAAVMAAIEGGRGQAQARLAEVYDDPEQRRAALTSRIAAAREATRGGR